MLPGDGLADQGRTPARTGGVRPVASLLDLEVDLIFFDTTSTYFETEDPDEPVAATPAAQPSPTLPQQPGAPARTAGRRAAGTTGARRCRREAGFRTYGKSKDSRDDLPQVIVGMAVTRDGIPVRVWCWPGNTADSPLIRQVKDDLRDWTWGRSSGSATAGSPPRRTAATYRAGGHGYILGEKLRSGSPKRKPRCPRQGRYQQVRDNLRVKEVKVSEDERFIICHNPAAADRDAAIRHAWSTGCRR